MASCLKGHKALAAGQDSLILVRMVYKTSIPGGTVPTDAWSTQGCLVSVSCCAELFGVCVLGDSELHFPVPCFFPWMICPHQQREFPQLQGAPHLLMMEMVTSHFPQPGACPAPEETYRQ